MNPNECTLGCRVFQVSFIRLCCVLFGVGRIPMNVFLELLPSREPVLKLALDCCNIMVAVAGPFHIGLQIV